jgi:hypothetical protein
MPVVPIELNARKELADKPLVWRLGKLFNVVTNIRRARVTEDYAHIALDIEGSSQEVEQAVAYLRSLGVLGESPAASAPVAGPAPETQIPQPNAIYVRLTTVSSAQGQTPLLYRVGKDFDAVVNIERAAFDEESGFVEITLSGPLAEVQRAIAYLHTTGIQVNPRQRSVTDYGNL